MNPASHFKPNLFKIKQHLQSISRERNFQTSANTLIFVQSYIDRELTSYGYRVQEDPFLYDGQSFSNLVARLEPHRPGPYLIVGAHFDSIPESPGADDNATGITALLEAARIYAERGERKGAVEFVAFNLEEYGMIGSQAYVQKLKSQNAQVAGMISLEMVGYTSREKGSQKMPFFLKPFYHFLIEVFSIFLFV